MSLTQTLPAKVFGFAARGILSAAAGAWQQIKTAAETSWTPPRLPSGWPENSGMG
jgi:hypothetical protein